MFLVVRDVSERGRTIDSVLLAYNKFVKKAYDEFIKQTMQKADIIIPKGAENHIAIGLVVDSIHHFMKRKLKIMLRQNSFDMTESNQFSNVLLYKNHPEFNMMK